MSGGGKSTGGFDATNRLVGVAKIRGGAETGFLKDFCRLDNSFLDSTEV